MRQLRVRYSPESECNIYIRKKRRVSITKSKFLPIDLILDENNKEPSLYIYINRNLYQIVHIDEKDYKEIKHLIFKRGVKPSFLKNLTSIQTNDSKKSKLHNEERINVYITSYTK